MDRLSCLDCGRSFSHRRNLNRHMKIQHSAPSYTCPICHKAFARGDNLAVHMDIHYKSQAVNPLTPVASSSSVDESSSPVAGTSVVGPLPIVASSQGIKRPSSNVKAPKRSRRGVNPPTMKSCLNTFFTYAITPNEDMAYDLTPFLIATKDDVAKLIKEDSLKHRGIKWHINVKVAFTRCVYSEKVEKCTSNFRSCCYINLMNESPYDNIEKAIEKVQQSFEEFQGRGSGWILDKIHYLETKIAVYKPLAPN